MEKTKRSSASLRIDSEILSIAQINLALNIEPTRFFEKGTHLSPRNPKSSIRKASRWILKSNLDKFSPIDEHIEYLISVVEQNISGFKKIGNDCTFDLFCGFFTENGQGSIELNSSLLKRISKLPIDLIFDIHVGDCSE